MATKRQVLKAIEAKWPGATLEVVKVGSNVSADIIAPDGFYFTDAGAHYICLAHWYTNDEMSAYWDEALAYIDGEGPGLTSCNDPDDPCSSVVGHADCPFLAHNQLGE